MVVGAGAGTSCVWWQHRSQLPPGIPGGNGPLESDEIDIDTKFAGRIAHLFVDEGEMVAAGQVVAMMDTKDLEASLKKSESMANLAQRALDEAKANSVQQQSQVTLAQQELERAKALVPKGFATVELLDQRRQQMNAAVAAQSAANYKVAQAQHALDAANHDVELYRVNILDNTLVASKVGRIQCLVIIVSVALSLRFVVRGLLGVPIAGSIPLFLVGAAIYLFFATAIGIFLGTIAQSMPQLGLLYLLIFCR